MVEALISVSVLMVVSGAIVSIFLVARDYYSGENRRIVNQQEGELFLVNTERAIRQSSSQVVYDNYTDQNAVLSPDSGTCLELTDFNGTATDTSDDEVNWFYLEDETIKWYWYSNLTGDSITKILVNDVNSLSFVHTPPAYFEITFSITGEPNLEYQSSVMARN